MWRSDKSSEDRKQWKDQFPGLQKGINFKPTLSGHSLIPGHHSNNSSSEAHAAINARPLAALKDPSSFPAPPRRGDPVTHPVQLEPYTPPVSEYVPYNGSTQTTAPETSSHQQYQNPPYPTYQTNQPPQVPDQQYAQQTSYGYQPPQQPPPPAYSEPTGQYPPYSQPPYAQSQSPAPNPNYGRPAPPPPPRVPAAAPQQQQQQQQQQQYQNQPPQNAAPYAIPGQQQTQPDYSRPSPSHPPDYSYNTQQVQNPSPVQAYPPPPQPAQAPIQPQGYPPQQPQTPNQPQAYQPQQYPPQPSNSYQQAAAPPTPPRAPYSPAQQPPPPQQQQYSNIQTQPTPYGQPPSQSPFPPAASPAPPIPHPSSRPSSASYGSAPPIPHSSTRPSYIAEPAAPIDPPQGVQSRISIYNNTSTGPDSSAPNFASQIAQMRNQQSPGQPGYPRQKPLPANGKPKPPPKPAKKPGLRSTTTGHSPASSTNTSLPKGVSPLYEPPWTPPNLNLQLENGWYARTPLEIPPNIGPAPIVGFSATMQRKGPDVHILICSFRFKGDLSVTKLKLEWHQAPGIIPMISQPVQRVNIPPIQDLDEASLNRASRELGSPLAEWCHQQMGKTIGRGECWDLVADGVKCVFPDGRCLEPQGPVHGFLIYRAITSQGDGRTIKKQLYPGATIQVGDILQFDTAMFNVGANGWEMYGAPDHTAVVYQVDQDHDMKFKILHQNVGGKRFVCEQWIDLASQQTGKLFVYRLMFSEWVPPLNTEFPGNYPMELMRV